MDDSYEAEVTLADHLVELMCMALSGLGPHDKAEHDASMMFTAQCIVEGVLRHNFSPDQINHVNSCIDVLAGNLHRRMQFESRVDLAERRPGGHA